MEKGRWKDGVLKTIDNKISYPVRNGIPNFVPSSVETWSEKDIKEIRKGDWIRRNWESQIAEAQTTSKRTEFFRLIAESEGIILDVASGPGGGNMPGTVYFNPEAKVLMSDLGVEVLHEWRSYLKNKNLGVNVCFAAFDATNMPIHPNSLDIVTSRGGFSNIPNTDKAVKEAYRILRSNGILLICEGRITPKSLSQLPPRLLDEWRERFPHLTVSFKESLKNAGFSIISYSETDEQALKSDEAEIPRIAAKHGVTLYLVECFIHALKS